MNLQGLIFRAWQTGAAVISNGGRRRVYPVGTAGTLIGQSLYPKRKAGLAIVEENQVPVFSYVETGNFFVPGRAKFDTECEGEAANEAFRLLVFTI